MAPNHLPICISKLQVHFEFKVHINVVGRAKKLKKGQNWLRIGQTMAIFSHNWLMLWRKKHKFINHSWHGGYALILGLFEQLEVSVPHNCFITLPGLSE